MLAFATTQTPGDVCGMRALSFRCQTSYDLILLAQRQHCQQMRHLYSYCPVALGAYS